MVECLLIILCIKSASIESDKFLNKEIQDNVRSLELFLSRLPRRKRRDGYEGDNGDLPLAAVSIIKEFEGCSFRAYPDGVHGGKPYTNGWGATQKPDGSEWKLGETITREQADKLLLQQLQKQYIPPLKSIPGWYQMKPHQQAAIVSFSYNLGAHFYGRRDFRTITKLLKEKNYSRKAILATFLMYRNPGTDLEEGLYRRRLAEAKLFLTGRAHTPMSLKI